MTDGADRQHSPAADTLQLLKWASHTLLGAERRRPPQRPGTCSKSSPTCPLTDRSRSPADGPLACRRVGAAEDSRQLHQVRWPSPCPTNPSPGYMLTALTKAILDKDPVLRDTWVSKIPQVSIESSAVLCLGRGAAGGLRGNVASGEDRRHATSRDRQLAYLAYLGAPSPGTTKAAHVVVVVPRPRRPSATDIWALHIKQASRS